MVRNIFLMTGLMLMTFVSQASAATVVFRGVLTSNPLSGGTLSLPLGDFEALVTTGTPVSNIASITGGFFKFGATTLSISGGIVSIPSANSMSFIVNYPSSVTSTFQFNGVTGLGSTVNQAALDLLGPPIRTVPFQIFQDSGGSTVALYGGSISSVPEPGSMIAVAGLAMGTGVWRWRKRRRTQLQA